MRWRMVYSAPGAPFIELVQGEPGSPWHCTQAQLHHLGCFTDDLDAGVAQIQRGGGSIETDGRTISGRWAYLRTIRTGALIELIEADAAQQEAFMATGQRSWGHD